MASPSLAQVDRSVTGLIAQQQCVGPLHTPLANVAVVAASPLATTGLATAVGEQPIKGLLDNAAQVTIFSPLPAPCTSISSLRRLLYVLSP
jgi:phosphoribosylformylglycinamidine (FGAM) synthase-like enzyme